MKFRREKALCILLLLTGASSVFSQVSMFRGGADHTASGSVSNDLIYANEEWKFNAGAPIRSSVAFSKGEIYFGASNGRFFSLDKKTGKERWNYSTGHSIASSPAVLNDKVFFSDNKQVLYALNNATGKLIWKFDLGKELPYEWAFDYYYSSPSLEENKIIIGSKDGHIYCLNITSGNLIWKFKTSGIVRSTPAIKDGYVYVGDSEGLLYSLSLNDGKQKWKYAVVGNGLKNEDFGFDRRAIISSPVATGNKVIAGGRDGFFYAVDSQTGKEIWRVDHQVSWVISSIAVKDSVAVTGTSDGRFVQAVNINTGKEIWKFRTINIVWSSAVIDHNRVYIGSHEGALYCLDLYSGKKIISYQAGAKIFTSPVISDSLLYFGSDNGYLHALSPVKKFRPVLPDLKRYVYWEQGVNIYFRAGQDLRVKELLASNGYKIIDSKKLNTIMTNPDSIAGSVIVMATNYLPSGLVDGGKNSVVRKFLENGGRLVALGINPLILQTDSLRVLRGFNYSIADSVLDINYGPADTRAYKGNYPAFPTEEGVSAGLQKFWEAPLPVNSNAVDVVLGKDENGLCSAWIKKFNKSSGSGFVQIWINAEGGDNLNCIMRVAEYQAD